jgi:hypothetical protein
MRKSGFNKKNAFVLSRNELENIRWFSKLSLTKNYTP